MKCTAEMSGTKGTYENVDNEWEGERQAARAFAPEKKKNQV